MAEVTEAAATSGEAILEEATLEAAVTLAEVMIQGSATVVSVTSAAILVIALAMALATVTMATTITAMATTASWIRAVPIIISITGYPAACIQAIPIITITAFTAGFTRPTTFTATLRQMKQVAICLRVEFRKSPNASDRG